MRFLTLACIIGLMIIAFSYLSSCQSNLNIETAQYAVNGQKLYATHCKNCHGGKGEGLGKLYPPLTDNEFYSKNREKLSCIVRNGMIGAININGVEYNEKMPPNKHLTDLDIAYILTYITTNFGQSDSIYSHQEVQNNLKYCK